MELLEKLTAAKVGIMCREELVPALLLADEMGIFVEGEDELKRGLGVLDEWCREWGKAGRGALSACDGAAE